MPAALGNLAATATQNAPVNLPGDEGTCNPVTLDIPVYSQLTLGNRGDGLLSFGVVGYMVRGNWHRPVPSVSEMWSA